MNVVEDVVIEPKRKAMFVVRILSCVLFMKKIVIDGFENYFK